MPNHTGHVFLKALRNALGLFLRRATVGLTYVNGAEFACYRL